MTFDEIRNALIARHEHETAAVLAEVCNQWHMHTLEIAETYWRAGRMTAAQWNAYCYLWRNLCPRFGAGCEEYTLDR